MAMKAPIYTDEKQVGEAILLNQLKEAVIELEDKMRATILISNGGRGVGWGVKKIHRSIAADSVMSIARAIKSLKGW